jgi:hypothetical protein
MISAELTDTVSFGHKRQDLTGEFFSHNQEKQIGS